MPEEYDDDFEQISDQEVLDYSPSKPIKNKSVKSKDNRNVVEKAKDTAGNTVDNVGKGVQTAGNVTQVAGKGTQAVGKGMQVAGKGTEIAGKGAQAAGKGVDAAGDAALNAGKALSSTGLGAIAGVPLAAVGAVGKVAGKGTETAGKGAEKTGQKINEAGKKVDDAGKKIENQGKNISKKGKDISDTGNRIKSSTKKGGQQPNAVDNAIDKVGEKVKKQTVKDILSKFDISKKIEESIDPVKKTFNNFKKWVKRSIVISVLIVLFFPTIIYILFSPILEAMQWMNEKLDDAIEITQKGVNFYNGFGMQTTKEAFYEELDYLYEEYDHQIDIPLIMATLFYKEREGYDTSFNFDPDIDDGIEGLDVASQKEEIKDWLSEKYESVFSTLDEDGKNYTIGKIYRLRKLAKNQMDSQLFGTAAPSQEEEMSFSDFLERSKSRLSDDVYQALQGLAAENPIAALPQTISKIHELTQINDGNEIWQTTSFGNESEAALGLQNLLKEILITAAEIKTIRYADGGFKVIVYKYNYSDDNFKNYLRKYYIRYMPEFKEDVGRLDGNAKEEAIDNIIREIYEYSDEYKEIFGYNENALSSDYDERCVGNIDKDLVKELGLPVESSEFEFSGSDAYGISNGKSNNGVNLNEVSAGVKEGDKVLSIADTGKVGSKSGKVIKVVDGLTCNTSTDNTCDPNGNYIIIEHRIKVDSNEYTIQSYYMNLKKGSIKVKEGDKVKKGDEIAKIGQTGDAPSAQLHFEIHDMNDGDTALNPTNLFIPCGGGGGGNGVDTLAGDSNKIKIWNFLLGLGYEKKAAAGIMGNWSVESGFEPNNLENESNTKSGYSDEKFTREVNSGLIKKDEFISSTRFGVYPNNSYGYGLAQWTDQGRKKGLYEFWKKKKTDVDDLKMQLDYFVEESKGYPGVKPTSNSELNKASSPESAADTFNRIFEVGTGSQKRRDEARKIYNELKDKNTNPKSSNMDNLTVKNNDSNDKKIESYLAWMKKIANDDSHGYSQGNRNGPNYDCSSFVYYALTETGVIKKRNEGAFSTHDMGSYLEANGFEKIKFDKSILQKGDILVRSSHTTTIYSKGKEVAAHTDRYAKADQIKIGNYNGASYEYIYRLK